MLMYSRLTGGSVGCGGRALIVLRQCSSLGDRRRAEMRRNQLRAEDVVDVDHVSHELVVWVSYSS